MCTENVVIRNENFNVMLKLWKGKSNRKTHYKTRESVMNEEDDETE